MLFLWMCYMLTYPLFMIYNGRLRESKIRFLIDAIWMLFIVGLFKIIFKKDEEIGNIIGATWIFRMYPFFLIGVVINRESSFDKVFGEARQRWFDIAGVLYIVFLSLVMTVFSGHLSLADASAPFAIYIVVWLFYKYRNTSNRIKSMLEIMGRQSLAIYLFHYFFVKSLNLYEVPGEFVTHNQLLMSTLAIFMATGICLICISLSWLISHNKILSFFLLGHFSLGKRENETIIKE